MRKILYIILMMTLFSVLPVPAEASGSLRDFDHDVLKARRYMRSYCARIQSAMENGDDHTAQRSLADARQAGKTWKMIQKKYGDNPPKEYAKDIKFIVRLETIRFLFDEMAHNIEQKKYKMSFSYCAYACGLFVQMHEENNLIYVSDRLFHLRKSIKKASAMHAAGRSLSETLAEIQQLRDEVYRAPFPENVPKFEPTLEKLSLSIDRLVYLVYNNNINDPENILNDLKLQVNALYSLSL